MSLLYEARDLVQRYGEIVALNLPGFSLEKEEVLVLRGPNGSGKSTLLRLLAFLERPSAGSLNFFGDSGLPPRRQASLMLQEPWLLRETVFDNVILGLRLRGQKHDLKEIYEEAMRAVGFARPGDFAKRRPGALSGGERQRVCLASRMVLRPLALLLDEPTAYVDRESAENIISALKALAGQGTAIVCATHDQLLQEKLRAREFCLQKGR